MSPARVVSDGVEVRLDSADRGESQTDSGSQTWLCLIVFNDQDPASVTRFIISTPSPCSIEGSNNRSILGPLRPTFKQRFGSGDSTR